MNGIGKSLRAKFTIILFVIGIIPLVSASLFFYFTARDALFNNVFKELKWNADELSGLIQEHFTTAGRDLVVASRNAAFTMYFTDPHNRAQWKKEQKKTLLHLRSLYPEIIDEACFIESTGKEVSRVVLDKISHDEELSSEEDRTVFFHQAFTMGDGEVYQARPTLSEDTKRWVLPNATPIFVEGKKAAILHFEVNMAYFQGLLNKYINPDRGYGFILNDKGEFMANTLITMPLNKPFPRAVDEAGLSQALKAVYERMIKGESGIEQFSSNGKEYYVIFRPISTSYVKGRNDNKWSLGYVIPAERVYVELSILRYNIIVLGLTMLSVIALAYVVGNYVTRPIRELANATAKVAKGDELPKLTEMKREDEIGVLSHSFNAMVDAIRKRDEELRNLAVTDGLTGLYNRRHFQEMIERELKAAVRYGRNLSLIMADVDFFKHYNDTHGHPQGDHVLKTVAEVFGRNIRGIDIAARYGGEEFVVILPETGLEDAAFVAERLRKAVKNHSFPFEEEQPNGDLTVSMGVASLGGAIHDVDSLLGAADNALYRAKAAGRDRVEKA